MDKILLTNEEIEQGLKLASEATPGPWEHHNWDIMERPHVVAHSLWNGEDRCNGHFDVPCTQQNTALIAFSNPLRVKAMLKELRELRSALIELRADIEKHATDTVWVGLAETACERITTILGDDWGKD